MTGGIAYVWDPMVTLKGRLADTAPPTRRPSDDDIAQIKGLLEEHLELTDSPIARRIQTNLKPELEFFWVVEPSGHERQPLAETIVATPIAG